MGHPVVVIAGICPVCKVSFRAAALLNFLLRLPVYFLPLALGLAEYGVRVLLKDKLPTDFLPASIASAALGLYAPLVVNDIPMDQLSTMSKWRQSALRAIGAISFMSFVLGIGLWIAVVGESFPGHEHSILPNFTVLGLDNHLTISGLLYSLR